MNYLITFLSFIFILIIGFLSLYFIRQTKFSKEIMETEFLWLQLIIGGIMVVTFIFFIIFMSQNVYIESDRICSPEVLLETTSEPNSYFILNSDHDVVAQQWKFDQNTRKNIVSAIGCFDYNNSDGGNEVRAVIGDQIQDSYHIAYIHNNTIGTECIEVVMTENISLTQNLIAGLVCLDCSPTNTLGIGQDIGASQIYLLESTSPTISYMSVTDFPLTWEFKLYKTCDSIIVKTVKLYQRVFYLMIILLGSFVMIFIVMRANKIDK